MGKFTSVDAMLRDQSPELADSLAEYQAIERPPHYTFSKIEPIDVIEAWKCDFLEGNIIKYVARWRHKDGVKDLRKAAWYLNRLIEREAVDDTDG